MTLFTLLNMRVFKSIAALIVVILLALNIICSLGGIESIVKYDNAALITALVITLLHLTVPGQLFLSVTFKIILATLLLFC